MERDIKRRKSVDYLDILPYEKSYVPNGATVLRLTLIEDKFAKFIYSDMARSILNGQEDKYQYEIPEVAKNVLKKYITKYGFEKMKNDDEIFDKYCEEFSEAAYYYYKQKYADDYMTTEMFRGDQFEIVLQDYGAPPEISYWFRKDFNLGGRKRKHKSTVKRKRKTSKRKIMKRKTSKRKIKKRK